MSAFHRLKEICSSLGVYKITEESIVFKELKAYSVGLDMLENALEELEAECFITTASSFGLDRRELMFGSVRKDLTVENRRNMLLVRSSFSNGDFTFEGISKILEFLGIKGSVQEYPKLNRVTIEVENVGLTKGQRTWMLSQMQQLFPAHLEVDGVFEGFSWAASDSLNQTFNEIDNLQKSWFEIDYYCI